MVADTVLNLIFYDPSASGVNGITAYSGRRQKKINQLYFLFTIVKTVAPDK